jgi:hypothetical protein
MAHGRNKYQSRENRAKVRQVLMQNWDPIGVKDMSGAEDEYDAYVGNAYVMLMDERATAEAIAAYLFNIATNHMGLSDTAAILECSRKSANILVSLRPGFETH